MRPTQATAVCAITVLLASCDNNNNDGTSLGFLQISNTIIDSPELTIDIGLVDADDDVGLFDVQGFKMISSISNASPEDYRITIGYEDPITGTTSAIPEFEVTVRDDTIHTLILRGTMDNPSVEFLEKDADVLDDEIEIQVVHTATVDSLDVYFGNAGADLAAESPAVSLSPGESSSPLRFAPGDYRLRVTTAGTDNVVFDSREFVVAEGSRRTIVIHDAVGPDATVKGVLQLTENAVLELTNDVAAAAFRLVNAVADESLIEVRVSIAATGELISTVELDFGEVTDFSNVASDFYDVSVQVASDPTAEAGATTVNFNQDTWYTLSVAGSMVDDSLTIMSAAASQQLMAGYANVTVVNAVPPRSEDDDAVDVYALGSGESLDDGAAAVVGVGYLAAASAQVAPTQTDLVVTEQGATSILSGPERIQLETKSNFLVVAAEAPGGGEPFQIIIRP